MVGLAEEVTLAGPFSSLGNFATFVPGAGTLTLHPATSAALPGGALDDAQEWTPRK